MEEGIVYVGRWINSPPQLVVEMVRAVRRAVSVFMVLVLEKVVIKYFDRRNKYSHVKEDAGCILT